MLPDRLKWAFLPILPALLVLSSVALIRAQTSAAQVQDPAIPSPRTERSYHPEANATRQPSNPYKAWPIENDLPYYIRVAPNVQFYECNESISKYPAAIPKPEEGMTCPLNEYPQKFLFKKPPVVDTPLAPYPGTKEELPRKQHPPQSSTGVQPQAGQGKVYL